MHGFCWSRIGSLMCSISGDIADDLEWPLRTPNYLGKVSPKWPILCWVGHETLRKSINRGWLVGDCVLSVHCRMKLKSDLSDCDWDRPMSLSAMFTLSVLHLRCLAYWLLHYINMWLGRMLWCHWLLNIIILRLNSNIKMYEVVVGLVFQYRAKPS